MDFLTFLKYFLAVVETAALIGAMVNSAKGFRERKNKDTKRSLLTQAAIYFAVYVALNFVRFTYFQ